METEILQENQEESAKILNEQISAAAAMPEETPEVAEKIEKIAVGDVLTQEEFENRFFELFDLAGDLTGVQELKINREKSFEVAGAKKTSEKLYNCAQKYKIMHFLIENQGGWLGDAILIGGFCYAKANIVVYHYSGQTLGGRLLSRFKRLPASVQQKASIFSRFFKKEIAHEESDKA